jgi:hypothetical protein
MREELFGPKVEKVGVAVVEESLENNELGYSVYLLNLRDDIMEGIIITSRGYGQNPNTGETIKTSTLRHCLEILLPNEAAKIEPISEEVFGISNEYWVSFWIDGVMYDKKFIFVAESINKDNIKTIPVLGAKGVIIL